MGRWATNIVRVIIAAVDQLLVTYTGIMQKRLVHHVHCFVLMLMLLAN